MKSFLRFIKDVQYDLLVPPYGLDHANMTPKQAENNFNWFLSVIPERIEYLSNRCAQDMRLPRESLDYSLDSLEILWQWFLKTARLEPTPEEELQKMKEASKIFGPSFINEEQFSVSTKYIMRDIGMYLGETWIHNYPNLYWSYKKKPKNDMYVNQPLISGFKTTYMGVEGPLFFQPIHMVEIQAANIFDKTQNNSDLRDLFLKWTSYASN